MQQRVYRGGSATPQGLADFLVQQYVNNEHLTAQKMGEGNAMVVQIGRRDRHDHDSHAATIGITHPPHAESDLVVTLGEQQWLDSGMIGYVAMMSLVAVIFTPLALFALIWPAARFLGHYLHPNEIWTQIDAYIIGQGGIVVADQMLDHPHLGQPVPPVYAPQYPPSEGRPPQQ